jgi:hypothetical protein
LGGAGGGGAGGWGGAPAFFFGRRPQNGKKNVAQASAGTHKTPCSWPKANKIAGGARKIIRLLHVAVGKCSCWVAGLAVD